MQRGKFDYLVMREIWYTHRQGGPLMFRFSIRDMLLVTLVVALSTGWWIQYSKMRYELEALQWESEKLQLILKSDGYELDLSDRRLTITVAYRDGLRTRFIDR